MLTSCVHERWQSDGFRPLVGRTSSDYTKKAFIASSWTRFSLVDSSNGLKSIFQTIFARQCAWKRNTKNFESENTRTK